MAMKDPKDEAEARKAAQAVSAGRMTLIDLARGAQGFKKGLEGYYKLAEERQEEIKKLKDDLLTSEKMAERITELRQADARQYERRIQTHLDHIERLSTEKDRLVRILELAGERLIEDDED